jgi:hypothetical protein
MTEPKFTHKGWFMLCPIKIADPFDGIPCIAARWWWLEFWFSINEGFQQAQIMFLSLLNPDYEPRFMFKVSGEL